MNRLLMFGSDECARRVAFDVERWRLFEVVAFVGNERPASWPTDRGFCLLSEVRSAFGSTDTWAFAAGTERHLNQDRLAAFMQAKGLGFRIASIVSPSASVASDVRVRENSYIGDDCAVLPGANLGANVWIERGCHVGLSAKIGQSCWLAHGCIVGDGATLGKSCTLFRSVSVAAETTLPAWSLISEFRSVEVSPPHPIFRDPLFRADVILRGTEPTPPKAPAS